MGNFSVTFRVIPVLLIVRYHPLQSRELELSLDMLDFTEDLSEFSQKLLDHYADCWKRILSSILMNPAIILLKKSNLDYLKLPSWQNQIGTENLKSCVMPVILQWQLYWDRKLILKRQLMNLKVL